MHSSRDYDERCGGGVRNRPRHSARGYAELNDSPELDIGNPEEFGRQYAALKRRHPQINVMGGCCGTDYRHIEQVALACKPLFQRATVLKS